ncbi:hypothetical protein K8B33_03990 [Alcanivorax sp. JB21]|uniref:GTP-binding protein n=1 Tax=Alcanivorax limicola TaxID=2874102 RepID=UPI001CBF884F|nr:GTP-binding protein [Alcanivorax limicola]MBZ2188242.1 hypothetical protein [Alcanivorax limicola]
MDLVKTFLALVLFAASPVWANQIDVVLLGDDARMSVMEQCRSSCSAHGNVLGAPSRSSSASDVASYAQHAKHAVIVIDATQGPLPITREHIQIARQAGVPSLSMMFVNMRGLEGMRDAGELVELVELEVRELMNAYAMDGDSAMVFHDSRIRVIPSLHTNGVGLQQVLERVSATPPRRLFDVAYLTGTRLDSYVYVLTPEESRLSRSLANGSEVVLWVNGQVARGTVSAGALTPGDNGELVLQLTSAVKATEGSRFLLERDGRVVGMGVVVRVRS